MNAIKRYWAWQKRPFGSFVAGAVLSGSAVKFNLLSALLSLV